MNLPKLPASGVHCKTDFYNCFALVAIKMYSLFYPCPQHVNNLSACGALRSQQRYICPFKFVCSRGSMLEQPTLVLRDSPRALLCVHTMLAILYHTVRTECVYRTRPVAPVALRVRKTFRFTGGMHVYIYRGAYWYFHTSRLAYLASPLVETNKERIYIYRASERNATQRCVRVYERIRAYFL